MGTSPNSSAHVDAQTVAHASTHRERPHSLLAVERDVARPRFLSEADCHNLTQRLARIAVGGGHTVVEIDSTWTGNVRWARNLISTSGEVCDNQITVTRKINGAWGKMAINETTDAALVAASRQAERLAAFRSEARPSEFEQQPLPPILSVPLFSEATYQLDASRRTAAAVALAKKAMDKGMMSAGYIEVVARSVATLDTLGHTVYCQWTQAQYSVTVRDPAGTGSGWAGDVHYDWAKLDGPKLTGIALEKCLQAQNPVKVEPGRYTAILEPQAVCDFVGQLIYGDFGGSTDFHYNLHEPGSSGIGPFWKDDIGRHHTYLGEQIIDERITISADPQDPEGGFPPVGIRTGEWDREFDAPYYQKVTWIDKGVLTSLSGKRRDDASSTGGPNSRAFRMSGGTTTIEEMIATTKRGLLVTRFDRIEELQRQSQLYRGYTRDGLWLIENGKISKPVKNMVFTESVLFGLNNVEQLGVPQRVFHVGAYRNWPEPVYVPPLKIREFSFTALTDAV